MKKKTVALAVIALLLLTAFCPRPQALYAKDLGLDTSPGEVLFHSDSHGGFHGDGLSYTVIGFSDESLLTQIQSNTKWKPFPLDETVSALVYGTSHIEGGTTFYRGPLTDEAGSPLFPEIQRGYYCLIDRQADQTTPLLQRPSFNYSLGIYDCDTKTLYYCEMDT